MKAIKIITLLLVSVVAGAQNDPTLVCENDASFISSCIMESRVFKPGVKVGFLDECTNDSYNKSKLFLYESVPQTITKEYFEDNGIPQNQLKDLTLTVTGIENLQYRDNRNLTFFIADGSDGKKYRYYLVGVSDTVNPSSTDINCIYLVEEHEKFSKIIGQTIYGKNNLWSDKTESGELKTIWGKKYYPLQVTGIIPARGLFLGAYFIRFKPKGSDNEYYKFCENSEFFYTIFTLCDPRDSFRNIKDKDWEALQKGEPETGMKKDILELTLGKPDYVSTYKTNNDEQEVWLYRNLGGKSYQIVIKKDKVESFSSGEFNRR